jgi:hypothetical protein
MTLEEGLERRLVAPGQVVLEQFAIGKARGLGPRGDPPQHLQDAIQQLSLGHGPCSTRARFLLYSSAGPPDLSMIFAAE